MRNMSFALTEPQVRDGSKLVTRRLGWKFLKVGDRVMACRKCMGLKPGEGIVRLREIVVVSVTREALCVLARDEDYGAREAALEGFPQFTGEEFVAFFCEKMKVRPEDEVTRIEFRYVEGGGA